MASMGPRLFSRGNLDSAHEHAGQSQCFNGATTFQPWKCSSMLSWPASCRACFNGATTFQPWKCDCSARLSAQLRMLQWGHDFSAVEIIIRSRWTCSCEDLLQWGHDFSAVEISGRWALQHARLVASMGPRLFSRGNDRSSTSESGPQELSFNGATTFQPWKLMLPRCAAAWIDRLQWGHDFSAVEIELI